MNFMRCLSLLQAKRGFTQEKRRFTQKEPLEGIFGKMVNP
jgi:hypothetical protein